MPSPADSVLARGAGINSGTHSAAWRGDGDQRPGLWTFETPHGWIGKSLKMLVESATVPDREADPEKRALFLRPLRARTHIKVCWSTIWAVRGEEQRLAVRGDIRLNINQFAVERRAQVDRC